MPVYVHVIDHPDGRVLVDTGIKELHPRWPTWIPASDHSTSRTSISPASTSSSTPTCISTTAAATTSSPASRSTSSVANSTTRAPRTTTPSASGSTRPACGTCRSTASSSCCPGSDLSRRRATPAGSQVVVVETGGRPVVIARRRRSVVRRTRRAAHRGPAAGPCTRPRAGLARARAQAMATQRGRCLASAQRGRDDVDRSWHLAGDDEPPGRIGATEHVEVLWRTIDRYCLRAAKNPRCG